MAGKENIDEKGDLKILCDGCKKEKASRYVSLLGGVKCRRRKALDKIAQVAHLEFIEDKLSNCRVCDLCLSHVDSAFNIAVNLTGVPLQTLLERSTRQMPINLGLSRTPISSPVKLATRRQAGTPTHLRETPLKDIPVKQAKQVPKSRKSLFPEQKDELSIGTERDDLDDDAEVELQLDTDNDDTDKDDTDKDVSGGVPPLIPMDPSTRTRVIVMKKFYASVGCTSMWSIIAFQVLSH